MFFHHEYLIYSGDVVSKDESFYNLLQSGDEPFAKKVV